MPALKTSSLTSDMVIVLSLVDNFMRIAKQKQEEITLLNKRSEQIKKGGYEKRCDPVRILELAQNLSGQYLKLSSHGKRQIVKTVFSNLRLNDVTLYGDYKLPFAILAKNALCPFEYAREDSNLWPSV